MKLGNLLAVPVYAVLALVFVVAVVVGAHVAVARRICALATRRRAANAPATPACDDAMQSAGPI